VEGDQLTIEAYWEPGEGTSPRWGEDGGEILHFHPRFLETYDSGAPVTRTQTSRTRCDGDFPFRRSRKPV
jgi:hypothetical protein